MSEFEVQSGKHMLVLSSSEFDAERPCGLRAACRVLPPALLHRLIVLAGARTCIARLGVPIFGRDRRVGECLLLREERKSGLRGPISVFDPSRTFEPAVFA